MSICWGIIQKPAATRRYNMDVLRYPLVFHALLAFAWLRWRMEKLLSATVRKAVFKTFIWKGFIFPFLQGFSFSFVITSHVESCPCTGLTLLYTFFLKYTALTHPSSYKSSSSNAWKFQADKEVSLHLGRGLCNRLASFLNYHIKTWIGLQSKRLSPYGLNTEEVAFTANWTW